MVGGVIIQGRLLEMRTLILESGAVVVSSGNELHDWNKSKKKEKTNSMKLTERRRIRV